MNRNLLKIACAATLSTVLCGCSTYGSYVPLSNQESSRSSADGAARPTPPRASEVKLYQEQPSSGAAAAVLPGPDQARPPAFASVEMQATAAREPVAALTPIPAPVTALAPRLAPETWMVQSGAHLRDTLSEWAARAGWNFVWALPVDKDFRLGASDTYEGSFKVAVTTLIDALPPGVRIRAELRPDNKPPLLYVSAEEGAR